MKLTYLDASSPTERFFYCSLWVLAYPSSFISTAFLYVPRKAKYWLLHCVLYLTAFTFPILVLLLLNILMVFFSLSLSSYFSLNPLLFAFLHLLDNIHPEDFLAYPSLTREVNEMTFPVFPQLCVDLSFVAYLNCVFWKNLPFDSQYLYRPQNLICT